uniref:Uncharacterized protein n=1 Tax=Pseudomonas phage RVTF4 TaxID=3236931 RepID=A0AB39CCX3_9VIRU
MQVQVPQLECHVINSIHAQTFAARFFDEKTKDVDHDQHGARNVLRLFQKHVMDIYHDILIESATIDDDFLHDEDPDVVAVYQIYKEYKSFMPRMEIVSMMPITLGGAVIIVANDTNPIIPLGMRALNPHQ